MLASPPLLSSTLLEAPSEEGDGKGDAGKGEAGAQNRPADKGGWREILEEVKRPLREAGFAHWLVAISSISCCPLKQAYQESILQRKATSFENLNPDLGISWRPQLVWSC